MVCLADRSHYGTVGGLFENHIILGSKFVSVRVRVTLQLTACQSVHLGLEPTLGLATRCFPLEG
jgi:hypothetical protein